VLHELFPGVGLFGMMLNPKFPAAARQATELAEAARTIGRPIILLNASTDAELDAALAALVQQRVVAVLVVGDPFFDTRRDHIIAFAAQQKLPALYQFREYAMDGGLMSYGASLADSYRQAGLYAGRILKGERPADLPVVQPTKFELVLNLKTAKALGLTIPDKVMALADEVIE
jgi:putative tryptophan/tyrosine transport system substrate-binding protein